jgi:imidazolonepropionase-like amidohydrolase
MNRSEGEQSNRIERELEEIDAFFDQAIAYVEAKRRDETVKTDVRFEAMRDVLSGAESQKPLFIEANDVDQITSAVTWAAERGLKCVIVGGRDAVLASELLKKHDVGVILMGTHNFPKRSDSFYDEAFTRPARMEEAGLKWCLASGENAAHERNIRHHAGTSAAYGLDQDAAVRAITLSAAEMLGVADTLGSIDEGKAATVLIADGNILEITTRVERAFIDGREIDLNNKQRALDEKYREKYRQLGITSGQ